MTAWQPLEVSDKDAEPKTSEDIATLPPWAVAGAVAEWLAKAESQDLEDDAPTRGAHADHSTWEWLTDGSPRPKVVLSESIGPTIPWLRLTAVVMLATTVGTLWLGEASATCSAGGSASYPAWLWLTLLPPVALRLLVEWDALRHFLPPYVKDACNVGEPLFKVLGRAVPFRAWLLYYALCSNLNFVDAATDSLFVATFAGTLRCSESKLESLWAALWKHMGLGVLGIPEIPIKLMVYGCWALTLIQLIVPILATLDRAVLCWRKNYNVGTLGHTPVFWSLSEASGLASLQGLFMSRLRENLKNPQWPADTKAMILERAAGPFANRILLSYFLENCVQAMLQTTLFAINRKLTDGGSIQLQALISVALSIAMTMLKLTDVLTFLNIASKAHDQVDTSCSAYAIFTWQLRLIKFGGFAMVVSLGYSVCKLGGTFWCEDYIWSITGCVDLDL